MQCAWIMARLRVGIMRFDTIAFIAQSVCACLIAYLQGKGKLTLK